MLLGARLLTAVSGINDFAYTTQVEAGEGSAFDIYFQLIDREKHRDDSPPGLRYVPATGATVSVEIQNLDSAKKFTRTASVPFAGDTSIWKAPILATDPVRGTVSLKVTLNESGVIKTFFIQAAVLIDSSLEVC